MTGTPIPEPAPVRELVVSGIDKRFGAVAVLASVSLTVRRGEFVTLLGPSGCGKTTLLRIIAGLELADRGRVVLNGQDLTALPANRRPVNTVFQNYALFPHLDVHENIAFGLRSRRLAEADIARRVQQALAMLRLEDFARRRPDQLSGGQRQRVAVARALVNEPEVLLLDEPLSALDAQLRAEVQLELRRLQRQLGTTFLLVTHDQDEAMTVSDRILVMRQGRIEQDGTPAEVYAHPRTRFVAGFLGAANLITATPCSNGAETPIGMLTLPQPPPWHQGTLAIRPERIVVHADRPAANAVRAIPATVRECYFRGDHLDLVVMAGAAGEPLRVRTPPTRVFAAGDEVWLEFPPEHIQVLDD